ncbi:hypothetical protein B296_00032846, partial [Ensete ventricosum]
LCYWMQLTAPFILMSCRWRGQAVPEEDSVVSRIQRIQWWPSPSCSAPGSCRAGAWQVAPGADEGTANGRMIGSQSQNPPPPNPENSMVAFALLLCSWKLSCCAVGRFGAASVGAQRNGGSTLRLQKLKRLRGSRKTEGGGDLPRDTLSVCKFCVLVLKPEVAPVEAESSLVGRNGVWEGWGAGAGPSYRRDSGFHPRRPRLPQERYLLSSQDCFFVKFSAMVFDLDAEDLTLFKMMHQQMVGIMFQDITTLLLDPKAFKNTVDLFVERYIGKDVSVVAGKFLDLAALLGSVTSRYM